MPKRPTKDPNFSKLQENIDLEQFAFSVKGAFQDIDDPRPPSKSCFKSGLQIFQKGFGINFLQ